MDIFAHVAAVVLYCIMLSYIVLPMASMGHSVNHIIPQ